MALISRIPVAEVAAVIARALEDAARSRRRADDGRARARRSRPTTSCPKGATRTIVLPFSDGVVGEVTLVVGERVRHRDGSRDRRRVAHRPRPFPRSKPAPPRSR